MLDRIEGSVLRFFARWEPHFARAIEATELAPQRDAILADARERLVAMLKTIPDPGWTAPQMRAFTMGGAIYVAVHLALAARGWDAARTWAVCEDATKSQFASMRGIERKVASDGMFGWSMKALSRWLAKKSQDEPVGGWVFEFVEGEEGQFDYGVNYTRCAIRDLAIANGAADFAPYICLSDVVGSNELGWGLARGETLAQGGSRCDFRFRRNGPTEVRVRLPVVRS